MALNGIATQSSDQSLTKWKAAAALDDCVRQTIESDCCTHTSATGKTEAWWHVDLKQPRTIQYIRIYYRDKFAQRFAGYQLYVSNTTDRTQGILFYEDTSINKDDVELDVTLPSPYVARYVIVYNYRQNPKRQTWYSNTAVLELCEVQVFGCDIGTYGSGNCDQMCSENCFGGNCDASNGHCFYCSPEKHGNFCEQACSVNCKDGICEKDSAHCTGCLNGKYGSDCHKECSESCKIKTCNVSNGHCVDCVLGKHGNMCEIDCPNNCKDKTCLKDNGHCIGCVRGKQGLQCAEDCPSNCVTCMQVDGQCTECVQGKYGTDCEQNCHDNCKDSLCTKDDGTCPECQNGYHGMDCTLECESNCKFCQQVDGDCTECLDGLYGGNCSLSCVNCERCSRETGKCLTFCIPGYEGEFCQMSINSPPQDDFTGTTVGIVVGLLLLVSSITIGVVFIIRRRRQNPLKKEGSFGDLGRREVSRSSKLNNGYESDERTSEQLANLDNVYVNSGNVNKTTDPYEEVYCNSGSEGIAISDLTSLVKTKMLNKAKVFEDEYKSLPLGDLYEHKVGMMTENKPKNRFKSTFPYDHSRVVLDKQDKDPHSDYINASYIDSVTLPAEYIATQGPTNKTVDDLWRMIWQLKSGKIIMLTNLSEGPKKKCVKYWPDEGQPMSTKHFEIVLDRERVYAFYVIRDIILTEKKTKSVRQVHQFHYTTWPDHGTPNPNELVVFHRRVKLYKNSLPGKMVVHCSAGIGRTGTFIALDALLDYGKESGMVDIIGYIRTMRKDRVNMVQTIDQYIALHNILIEAFDMPDTLIPKVEYHAALNRLSDDVPVNQTKLWQEYQLLQTMKPTYTKVDYKAALLPVNRNKNKDPNVLAVDKFRAYLTSSLSDRTDYINAVAVPSYTSRTGYIITQSPLDDTNVDILTMIMDNQCDTIVIIEKDSVKWLPEEGKDISIGKFTLKHLGGSSNLVHIDLIEIAISNQSHKYDTKVRVFRMTGWDRDVSVPPDSSAVLQLLELVDSRRRSHDSKTTVVMCRDGYTQSGLFCCVSNARDQMKIDEEVDMFQISRQVLVRRPECITSVDQYKCCYNLVKEYLDTTDVYVN
ncbi:receptor-type tyrosine-protein phosphatase T-like [Mizuhopecten yessoensis]|uniref:receptor-type tyrosine-protein phosphatase T-like n=1 Tax=Mizuhopecten yessoensis TaxID=6573 RepID=UPI000B45AB61|nr:receptor-type tyrosine-protein phosphatase T-like [Mizuhopecten yessoensis]